MLVCSNFNFWNQHKIFWYMFRFMIGQCICFMLVFVSAFSLLCESAIVAYMKSKRPSPHNNGTGPSPNKPRTISIKNKLIGDVQASATASAARSPENRTKKTRLWRRNSDETASRCVKLKLGMFSPFQVANNVDSNNDSVHTCEKRVAAVEVHSEARFNSMLE